MIDYYLFILNSSSNPGVMLQVLFESEFITKSFSIIWNELYQHVIFLCRTKSRSSRNRALCFSAQLNDFPPARIKGLSKQRRNLMRKKIRFIHWSVGKIKWEANKTFFQIDEVQKSSCKIIYVLYSLNVYIKYVFLSLFSSWVKNIRSLKH